MGPPFVLRHEANFMVVVYEMYYLFLRQRSTLETGPQNARTRQESRWVDSDEFYLTCLSCSIKQCATDQNVSKVVIIHSQEILFVG
jgi:hypothetical protein